MAGLTAKKVYAILNGKIQKVASGIGTAIFYAGSVATENDLPSSPEVGALYNIESDSSYGSAGMNVAWTGEIWDPMGPTIDLSTLKVPNPNKLTFSGAVSAEYDGSAPVNIEIPQSGGGVISENKLTVNNHIISLESGGSSA